MTPDERRLVIRLRSGDVEAWGESTPLERPEYSPEWAGGAFEALRQWMAPALIGHEISSGEDLQERLSRFKGNHFAKAAVDTAWWVLEARCGGQPLYQLLGGRRTQVEVGADFGVMDCVDDLLRSIADAVTQGYRRVKLKFRPGWDFNMLEAVRSDFPELTVHVDCNSGFRLSDAPVFKKLDQFGLAMIEQPLSHDDLVDHAKLQKQLQTPICLDESITSVHRMEQAIELGSCRYVNVKPGRVGGLTSAVAIHDLCRDAGIPCWVGGNLESGIGAAIAVALATLENFVYPADIFPSSRFYRQDLAVPLVRFSRSENGAPCAIAEDTEGLVQAPERERLAEMTVQRAVVGTQS